MRVLHVIPSVSALRGGPSAAIVELVRAQRALGIDASIATTNDDGEGLLQVDTKAWSVLEDVPCRYFDRWSPSIRPLREFAYSNAFRRWIGKHIEDYDLVHVHAIFSACSSLAMTIARKHNVPYIVRTIGLLDRWSLSQSVLRKSLFLKALEHKNLKGAATIHATSELEAEQILAFDPSLNVEIVPLGITDVLRPSDPTQTIDTNIDHVLTKSRSQAQIELKQQLSIDPSCPMLLFLARLHPKKGLERIVSALADTASLNTAHLLIAGSGEPQYERSLHHLCEQLGIAERVHFLGFLKEGQKRQALLGSDLYVLPSANENFGISVLEALNAGLPPLVSTGVALHDLVAKESLGGVIDLDAPSTNLGDSITLLLSSPDDLQAMGMKARRYTQEHYSWTSIATELKTIYARLIGLNKPS